MNNLSNDNLSNDNLSNNNIIYNNPLIYRYSSKIMNYIWSPTKKFTTWRKLWYYLAESQKELNLNITNEQLYELKNNIYNINYDIANEKEKEIKHDVMAHVYSYAHSCPKSKGIIHLGATSCFITDNTDIILMRDSLLLILDKILIVLNNLKTFANNYKHLPTLGYTHFQAAQLTTVGKRCTLWMQDILMDFNQILYITESLKLRGIKGTTGTQASFLELFNGNHEYVKLLDKKICNKLGFNKSIFVSGQTYTRKIDYNIISSLSGLAQSIYKMSNDIRLLASLKEIEEPFEENQVGSSAMAYKRNPMLSERTCSLSRYLMGLPNYFSQNTANQWLERTLDDSAIRRITIPEAFLTADSIINLIIKISSNIVVWPACINKNIINELPFMATEIILMYCVKHGGDRQVLHEAIRKHSKQASFVVKNQGKPNDLFERIKSDNLFSIVHNKLEELIKPELFIGRAEEQTSEFIEECINPILNKYKLNNSNNYFFNKDNEYSNVIIEKINI